MPAQRLGAGALRVRPPSSDVAAALAPCSFPVRVQQQHRIGEPVDRRLRRLLRLQQLAQRAGAIAFQALRHAVELRRPPRRSRRRRARRRAPCRSPSPKRRTAAVTTPSGRSVRRISQVAASSPSTKTSTTPPVTTCSNRRAPLGDAIALAHHRVLVDAEHVVGALLDPRTKTRLELVEVARASRSACVGQTQVAVEAARVVVPCLRAAHASPRPSPASVMLPSCTRSSFSKARAMARDLAAAGRPLCPTST